MDKDSLNLMQTLQVLQWSAASRKNPCWHFESFLPEEQAFFESHIGRVIMASGRNMGQV
jgi:hypothetical protein